MESLLRLRAWLDAHRDLGLEMVRIYLGFALFAKGVAFVRQGMAVLEEMTSTAIGFGEALLAHYVVMVHIGGGVLLALGLVTRLAAAVQLPVLAGAVFLVHAGGGLFASSMALELTLLVLFLLVIFTLLGGGRLSIDRFVFARDRRVMA
jgi:uncharacterized membrane protein YphA (DoxX/SURF4 family)